MGSNSARGPTARLSLFTPLPEHETAAELLSEAADAAIVGDQDRARDLVRAADLPALHALARRVMDTVPAMHAAGPQDQSARMSGSEPRMPNEAVRRRLGDRDGWRCRFCGCRVVVPRAVGTFARLFPETIVWELRGLKKYDPDGKKRPDHGGFEALSATADHVVPYSAGGGSGEDNIVTTCWPCNFGKAHFTIEQLGLSDPRVRPPVRDGWDGLWRLADRFPADGPQLRKRPTVEPREETVQRNATGQKATAGFVMPSSHTDWEAAALRVTELLPDDPLAAHRFNEMLSDREMGGLTVRLGKTLIVRLSAGGQWINVFGIEGTGFVQVPWQSTAPKDVLLPFVEALAKAIPGTRVQGTAKLWSLAHVVSGPVHLGPLLAAAPSVRDALRELRTGLLAIS